jgi:hypothetical protein
MLNQKGIQEFKENLKIYIQNKQQNQEPIELSKNYPIQSIDSETFTFLVIGGTYSRLAKFENNLLEIIVDKLRFQATSGKDLIEHITQLIIQQIDFNKDKGNKILINLALPLKYVLRENQIDIQIQKSVKNHQVDSLIYQNLGQILIDSIFAQTGVRTQIWIWNDLDALAHCCFETDLTNDEILKAKSVFILGTGLNAGFWSESSAGFLNFQNLELGEFSNFKSPTWFQKIYPNDNITSRKLEIIASGSKQKQHLQTLTNSKLNNHIDYYLEGCDFSEITQEIWLTGQNLTLACLQELNDISNQNNTLVEGGLINQHNYQEFLIKNDIRTYNIQNSNLVSLIKILSLGNFLQKQTDIKITFG